MTKGFHLDTQYMGPQWLCIHMLWRRLEQIKGYRASSVAGTNITNDNYPYIVPTQRNYSFHFRYVKCPRLYECSLLDDKEISHNKTVEETIRYQGCML